MSRGGIAFLDVDHTVIRHTSGRYFLALGVREGLFPLSSLLVIPSVYLRFRLRLTRQRRGLWEFPLLRGKTRQSLEALAEQSFRLLERHIYPQAVSLIASLKAEGKRVAFATSSPDLIIRPLARRLGVDEVVATKLEFKNSVCTGYFEGPLVWKEEKKRLVLEYIRQQGFAPAEASFYTDSFQDLPLLEAVGEPVAVNPDPRLCRLARQRGWRILRFAR